MLSPNNNPALRGQRDHSGCRLVNSSLKVRKTRENLKQQANIGADIPPPCLLHDGCKDSSGRSDSSETSTWVLPDTEPDPRTVVQPSVFDDDSAASALLPSHVTVPGKMLRNKSVSRRMLSRVREGVTQRSKSSQPVRTADSKDSLIRRLSGKRGRKAKLQSRAPSLDVRQESSESDIDEDVDGTSLPSAYQRSFTDSTMSTDELFEIPSVSTPPPVRNFAASDASDKSPGSYSPTPQPTPRGYAATDERFADLPLPSAVPFVHLDVVQTRDSVDVRLERDFWVAVEATVRTKRVEAFPSAELDASTGARSPMDAIVWLDGVETEIHLDLARKYVATLSASLEFPADRLVIVRRGSLVQYANSAEWALEWVRLPRNSTQFELLEKIDVIVSDYPIDHFSEGCLYRAVHSLRQHGLRDSVVQVFLLNPITSALQKFLERMAWPVHQLILNSSSHCSHDRHIAPSNGCVAEILPDGSTDGRSFDDMMGDIRNGRSLGSIPTLRICFKPMAGSEVVEMIGQKAYKNLRPGQRCCLFLQVRVPRIETAVHHHHHGPDDTQESLFLELESIVGSLETPVLHVEVRYRHSLLPADNIVTARQICYVKRPRLDSRWSLLDSETSSPSSPLAVYRRLAQLVARQSPPSLALQLLERWIPPPYVSSETIQKIRDTIDKHDASATTPDRPFRADNPAVIVTEVDAASTHRPNTPKIASRDSAQPPVTASPQTPRNASLKPSARFPSPRSNSTKSFPPPKSIAAKTLTAPRTTTAVTVPSPPALSSPSPSSRVSGRPESPGPDAARQVWQHLRRSSKQLSSTPASGTLLLPAQQQQQRENHDDDDDDGDDEHLRALHARALANKRSVGAETLAAWRWEEREPRPQSAGEAPWLV